MKEKKLILHCNTQTTDVIVLFKNKINFFKDVIQETVINVQNNKNLDILAIGEVTTCIEKLGLLSIIINEFEEEIETDINPDECINKLQMINNELSSILKVYGTSSLDHLLSICLGNINKQIELDIYEKHAFNKFNILKKYFHPLSYKIINKLDDSKQKKYSDDVPAEIDIYNLSCFDVTTSYKQFHVKVYGIKLFVYSEQLKRHLMICGILDDVIIDYLNDEYINAKKQDISKMLLNYTDIDKTKFDSFLLSLGLKDYLVYNSQEIYDKYAGYLIQNKLILHNSISIIVKEFLADDIIVKRNTLIQLLLNTNENKNMYLAYLLYDLLSQETNSDVDTQEQTVLFDSLPWSIKQSFKHAMKETIQYTNELTNFDMNKIPVEQQICLMNAPDNVKEKAMVKLKELKAKSEDSGAKARQYLDGLLKIPFNIYKREKLLYVMDEIKAKFKEYCTIYDPDNKDTQYTSVQIVNYIKNIKPETMTDNIVTLNNITSKIHTLDKKNLQTVFNHIHNIYRDNKLEYNKINITGLRKKHQITEIISLVEKCKDDTVILQLVEDCVCENDLLKRKMLSSINENFSYIKQNMTGIKSTLDNFVYGHDKAKRQIERLIGQWVNGDKTGYCIGLEGNPGLGKTTLAKGLAECLKDENGASRPWSLVALGGDANSSSLVGHSYTYVGSIWGCVVQILMDKKCMNPIIIFDEVDKISKTEHGKEITGILTHLLDPTQNNMFQDKYFTGIDFDLSKALFIVSYNDVNSIDKVLLDRIHRIKFDSLTVDEKIVIANKYILPEIYKKIGVDGNITISNETIKFVIENYTMEPGVRKLKEKLYEIIGEVNLVMMKDFEVVKKLPLEITIDAIKKDYFKDSREVKITKIHKHNEVGVINCLWANVYDIGGILSATGKFIPSERYLSLKITGLCDTMMEESLQISLTNAFQLLSDERKKELDVLYNDKHKYGIHLHMGDGSVSKSGTSAGIAITILMYSLLMNKKIKNNYAVTGEAADLNGNVGEIGALNTKIIYGIKSGVKNFIFPKENLTDYDNFLTKNKDSELTKGIMFYPIETIKEAFDLVLE